MGENGRFLDLPGLRSLAEQVTLAELNALGIQVQHHVAEAGSFLEEQPTVGDRLVYKSMNWVRPRLSGGQPVWDVEWSKHEHAWIPVDRKKSRPLE
jgi:hypothetical protein